MWRPITEDELHLYVDGRLDRIRAASVEAFLEANPREARRVEDYCHINELMRDLGAEIEASLPPAGAARLRAFLTGRLGRRARLVLCSTGVLALVTAAGLGATGEALWGQHPRSVVATPGPTTASSAAVPVKPRLIDDNPR
jgi:anti-sigma factor RsiW